MHIGSVIVTMDASYQHCNNSFVQLFLIFVVATTSILIAVNNFKDYLMETDLKRKKKTLPTAINENF